jgi:uncharacterized protein YaaN involved in tellurite resistance
MSDDFKNFSTTPELSFDIPADDAPRIHPEQKEEQEILDSSMLSREELAQAEQFAGQIDLHNTRAIMQLGSGTQKKMSDFSERTLENIRTKDMGETGQLIADLMTELKNFDAGEERKGFHPFRKSAARINSLRAKYSKVESNVNEIVGVLEHHQATLLKDIDLLDRMYDLNLTYFKELSMYILAGKKALARTRDGELKQLQQKAEASGRQEDVQAARDCAAMCDRLEKKIYDLELTRTISVQTAPQLRLVQNSDSVMAEKIQSTIVNTIPLWKNQMVIAVGIEHSAQAARAQREVTDMTNELLKKNAKALQSAAVDSARESERGIVDIETLQETNQTLISTLDSVLQIQKEGREKRRSAEIELQHLEDDLKKKMLELSKESR